MTPEEGRQFEARREREETRQQRLNEIKNHLEEAGIWHVDELSKRLGEEQGLFLDILAKRFLTQAFYEVMTNVPTGLTRREDAPREGFKRALVGAVAHYLRWDLKQTQEFAADVLEDVNFHDLAQVVRDHEIK